jgi:hypothetical protein
MEQFCRFARFQRNAELIQGNCEALSPSFDIGFLAGPAGKKRFRLRGCRECTEFSPLLWREKVRRDAGIVQIIANRFNVDADPPALGDGIERQAARVGYIEGQSILAGQSGKDRFAVRIIVETQLPWACVQIAA